MTVSYAGECATTRCGTFFRLLLKWRGSLAKLVYRELLVFLAAYFAISLVYRICLNESHRILTFLLGFYVSMVINRWWRMYCVIPWPDNFAIQIATYVEGADERGKLIRRTLVRYLLASSVIALRAVSSAVKKRFPTMQHLVYFGLLKPQELQAVTKPTNLWRYWIPIQWCCTLLYRARLEGRIRADNILTKLTQGAIDFRNDCATLVNYDWICIPLVYTHVVTIAVYAFFLGCLFGRQYLNPSKAYIGHELDLYFPFFTVLQFSFYIGWLKVAETLMNPFGEDDDDFELVQTHLAAHLATVASGSTSMPNWIIERNVKVAFFQVTEQFDFLPDLEKDDYWNAPQAELPNTTASVGIKDQGFKGSASGVKIGFTAKWVKNSEVVTLSTHTHMLGKSFWSKLLGAVKRRLFPSRRPTRALDGCRFAPTGAEANASTSPAENSTVHCITS